MGRTYRKLTNTFQHRLRSYGITPDQWSILYHVGQAEGLMQKDIAERAGKDRPTTTRILDHLTEKGWVYKQADAQDRRSFLVFATEEGRRLLAETTPIETAFIAELSSCMSDEEYEGLLALIRRIDDKLERMRESEPDSDRETT